MANKSQALLLERLGQWGSGSEFCSARAPFLSVQFFTDRLSRSAGFTPVFANPKGNAVSYDPASNDKMFFCNDAARAQAVKFLEDIPELKHPETLAAIAKEGTADVGVLIPGGHAPMQDLI